LKVTPQDGDTLGMLLMWLVVLTNITTLNTNPQNIHPNKPVRGDWSMRKAARVVPKLCGVSVGLKVEQGEGGLIPNLVERVRQRGINR